MSIIIDSEFRQLIPPLSDDEFRQLEENCVRDGIRDPLVVWPQEDGDSILIDGHNRWEISAKHAGIRFKVAPKNFKDREEAKQWIILNQFGRRNLSAYDRSLLALKLKPMIVGKAKERQGTRTDRGNIVQKSARSRDELAKVAGVSHDTIHKVETIEAKATPEAKQQVRSGEKSINQAYNEIRNKEIKRPPSAKEYADQAKERHKNFQKQAVVSISDVKADQEDKEIIEVEVIQKVKKTRGAINELYVLIDAGELPVSALSDDGKKIVIGTLEYMKNRISMIGDIVRKR